MLLELVGSEDIMIQYEGVMQLKDALYSADERQLNKLPFDSFAKKLIALLKQPAIMDISNEIKSK